MEQILLIALAVVWLVLVPLVLGGSYFARRVAILAHRRRIAREHEAITRQMASDLGFDKDAADRAARITRQRYKKGH